jgi:hypothetical protein
LGKKIGNQHCLFLTKSAQITLLDVVQPQEHQPLPFECLLVFFTGKSGTKTTCAETVAERAITATAKAYLTAFMIFPLKKRSHLGDWEF